MVTKSGSKSARVRELLAAGAPAAAIAKEVGCTVGLVYNVKSRMGSATKRGPWRPRKVASPVAVLEIDSIVAEVQSSERERTRLRGALQRISTIISEVL